MFPFQLTGLKEILGAVQTKPFSLSNISRFPDDEFSSNQGKYSDYWDWFQGTPLLEVQMQGDQAVSKFPIKINPLKAAVIKHAYALFGEFREDSRPLVYPQFKPNNLNPEDKKAAIVAQNWINTIWWENSGRSLMMRNALLAQIMGGCIFRLSYVPREMARGIRSIPLKVDCPHPTNFIGIPIQGDEYRLSEAWLIQAITYKDAQASGISIDEGAQIYYVEHYTPDIMEFSINGMPIPTGEFDLTTGNPIYYGGTNPFGFVPIVYIPHIRVSGFYGESHVTESVKGIIMEMNARMADLGDASSDDSHRYYFMANTNGIPSVIDLAPGVRVINGGTNPSITGKESSPMLEQIGQQRMTEPMLNFIKTLDLAFRREVSVPAVADGEDEGSQRSSLTLAMRMWPLISHTRTERVYWGDALNVLTRMMVNMIITKGMIEGFPVQAQSMRIEQKWASMLPRDREMLINELVNRSSAKLGSEEHLLELTEDVEDPIDEMEKIKEWTKELATIEAEAQAKANPAPPTPMGVAPSSAQQKSNLSTKKKVSQ